MSREELISKYTQYKNTLENLVNSQQKLDDLCNTYKEKEVFNLYETHLKEEAMLNLQKETLNTARTIKGNAVKRSG